MPLGSVSARLPLAAHTVRNPNDASAGLPGLRCRQSQGRPEVLAVRTSGLEGGCGFPIGRERRRDDRLRSAEVLRPDEPRTPVAVVGWVIASLASDHLRSGHRHRRSLGELRGQAGDPPRAIHHGPRRPVDPGAGHLRPVPGRLGRLLRLPRVTPQGMVGAAKIPDCRGYFLRGLDRDAKVDSENQRIVYIGMIGKMCTRV